MLYNIILESQHLLLVYYLYNQLMKQCGPFMGPYAMTGPIKSLNKIFFPNSYR